MQTPIRQKRPNFSIPSGFPLYFGIEIQGLFKDFQGLKLHFLGGSLQHGQYYSNI